MVTTYGRIRLSGFIAICMKLADYLFDSGISPAKLQRELGITPTAFRRYLTNQRIPRAAILAKIRRLTGGAVTYEDFADAALPKCATVVTEPDGRHHVVLPWTQSDRLLSASIAVMLAEPKESDELTEPLRRALSILGPRARYLSKDRFELDHRPTDALRIVRAANTELEQAGLEPIRYPGIPARRKS